MQWLLAHLLALTAVALVAAAVCVALVIRREWRLYQRAKYPRDFYEIGDPSWEHRS